VFADPSLYPLPEPRSNRSDAYSGNYLSSSAATPTTIGADAKIDYRNERRNNSIFGAILYLPVTIRFFPLPLPTT